MRFSVPRSHNTGPLIYTFSGLIIVIILILKIKKTILPSKPNDVDLCKIMSFTYAICAVFRTPKPKYRPTNSNIYWSYQNLIHALSDPFVIRSMRKPIQSLSDPIVIWSNRYPIQSLSDPIVIWSNRYPIHSLSDPGWGIQVLSRKTIIGNLRSKFLIVFSSMRERGPKFTIWGIYSQFSTEN